jgi:hypothetical protein
MLVFIVTEFTNYTTFTVTVSNLHNFIISTLMIMLVLIGVVL